MERKDFIERLAITDNVSVEEIEKMYSIIECNCGDDICEGFSVVPNMSYLLNKCED